MALCQNSRHVFSLIVPLVTCERPLLCTHKVKRGLQTNCKANCILSLDKKSYIIVKIVLTQKLKTFQRVSNFENDVFWWLTAKGRNKNEYHENDITLLCIKRSLGSIMLYQRVFKSVIVRFCHSVYCYEFFQTIKRVQNSLMRIPYQKRI